GRDPRPGWTSGSGEEGRKCPASVRQEHGMADVRGEGDRQDDRADGEEGLGQLLHHAAAAPPGGGETGWRVTARGTIFRTRPQLAHVSRYAARPTPHFGQRTAASRPQTGQVVEPGARTSWSNSQYGSPAG